MTLTIETPALLFSATSLILLAYTNRFNVIAGRIRSLRDLWENEHDDKILFQLHNLRRRVKLIRLMQLLGVLCMFGCVLSMVMLYYTQVEYAQAMFVASLITMLVSLYLSIREIHLSVVSLDIVLSDLEKEMNEKQKISEETEKDFTKKYFR
jgi:Flp pilus assembly protein TadB